MRKLFWLVSGISIGLVLAKQIEENPKAKAIADDLKKAAREFSDAVVEGFQERETELADAAPKAKKPAARKSAK